MASDDEDAKYELFNVAEPLEALALKLLKFARRYTREPGSEG